MRPELRNISEFNYWVYGLVERDFDYTLQLIHNFIEASNEKLKANIERAKQDYPDARIHQEIISDLAYYVDIETQYLWQFCLWRFQGILEALITSSFLPEQGMRTLFGLKSKLKAMQESGYTLNRADYTELLAWANLRNSLSHAPPEQYRPGPLQESDVVEYKQLVQRVCNLWRAEETRVKGTKKI